MIIESSFRPKLWIKNRHLQTLWGTLFKAKAKLPRPSRERLELKDGDFIDVDIFGDKNLPATLLLHGLEGSKESHYIEGLTPPLLASEHCVIVMHFRGCSGESNRLLKSYHSGISEDLDEVLLLLSQNNISVEAVVGFSLGGNVLLKWLAENPSQRQVKRTVAVSVPMLLDECATAISQGFSRLYQKHLISSLKKKTLSRFPQMGELLKTSKNQIDSISNFWEFDDQVTAPLNGFLSAEDYYQKCSSKPLLKHIKTPTLIIHAADDPFMNSRVTPQEEELSEQIIFELSQHGGHVGFVDGVVPWRPIYYLEKRIPEFLMDK